MNRMRTPGIPLGVCYEDTILVIPLESLIRIWIAQGPYEAPSGGRAAQKVRNYGVVQRLWIKLRQ